MSRKQENNTHPLDGCDEQELHRILSDERNRLDDARRETEDNVVKTVIQLASGLVVLIAGFVAQQEAEFTKPEIYALGAALLFGCFAVASGLAEQFLSGRAYSDQLDKVTLFYKKESDDEKPSKFNDWVKRSQALALILFGLALASAVTFGVVKLIGISNAQHDNSAATSSATATSSSATAATSPTATERAKRSHR